MTTATENTVQAPSQVALDNIVETAEALLGELNALTGSDTRLGQVTLQLGLVPAQVWHALAGTALSSKDYTWKVIARHGTSRVTAFCEHGAECPDHPRCDLCGKPSSGGVHKDCTDYEAAQADRR